MWLLMITETKIQKEIIVKHKFCDICGVEINIHLSCSVAKCMYCGKDLCENCLGDEIETGGDYRTVICKRCWEIGNDYRPLIDKFNLKVSELYKEWQDECKVVKCV